MNSAFTHFQTNISAYFLLFQAIDVVTRKSEDEKLKWAFRLFDKDGSGKINVNEMASVLETMEGLEGKGGSGKAQAFAEKVFKLMDDDRDGEIEVDEFVKGYQKLKARQNSSSVTVTAFVRERVVEKPKKPVRTAPSMSHHQPMQNQNNSEESSLNRRKSLRDAGSVKSLFNK